jgi:hypothetical protein
MNTPIPANSTPAFLIACALFFFGTAFGSPPESNKNDSKAAPKAENAARNKPKAEKPKLVPLNPEGTVLVDKAAGKLLLKTKVVLRSGTLEMLCCKTKTKEHESILACDTEAAVVHAGMLLIGLTTGKPVDAENAPQGQEVDVVLVYKDAEGQEQRVRGQKWVRNMTQRFFIAKMPKLPEGVDLKGQELRHDAKLGELIWYGHMNEEQRDKFLALSKDAAFREAVNTFHKESAYVECTARFVFVGSGFYVDERTGEKFYKAEDGYLICVANFPAALIDVDMSSTDGNDGLLFEAYTERIPERGTPVVIEISAKKPADPKNK